MKHFPKPVYLLLLALLALAFVACGGGTTEPAADEPAAEEPAAEQPAAEEPAVEEPAAEEPAAEEPAVEEPAAPVTLRYANWNLGTEEENNIQRQLIQAYLERNPHVTIEFVDMSAEGGWDAVLTTYAARGELPDVFMANNVPLYVQNGWLADLGTYVQADPAWADVPTVLRESVTYGDAVLGLPAAQFIMGYFVNQDLYEAANLDAPAYGLSVDDFRAAVSALHNVPQGVLGLDEMEFVMGWYANAQDPNLKWFSFDGTHMNYNNPAFKDAIAFAGEMRPYTWQGLTEEQLTNFQSTGPWELFMNQEVGMRWDATWAVPGYVQNANFNWDFIGVPGGNQALVMDVMVVSNTAANIDEAYNFARWMTYSPEAYAVEADLSRAANAAPKIPVSIDQASLDIYTSFFDKPGLLAALNNLDNSMVESLAKVVPGYINARWEGKPGIDIGEDQDVNMWFMFNFANDGRYKYEDYSAQLETFANGILDDAAAQLEQ